MVSTRITRSARRIRTRSRPRRGLVTFVPIPKNTGLLAGLLTVDLPLGSSARGSLHDRCAPVNRRRSIIERRRRGQFQGARLGSCGRFCWKKRRPGRRLDPSANPEVETRARCFPDRPEDRAPNRFCWRPKNTDWLCFAGSPRMFCRKTVGIRSCSAYISQLAGRVAGFGGNPDDIPPSPTGNVPDPSHPMARKDEPRPSRRRVSGKVSGLVFDHFGDFEGFVSRNPT